MSTYTDSVERNLTGLEFVSTGIAPGCAECQSNHGFDDAGEFAEAVESGALPNEASFGKASCDICGSHAAGDREPWHAVLDGEVTHFDGACGDCVAYLGAGLEPEPEPEYVGEYVATPRGTEWRDADGTSRAIGRNCDDPRRPGR